MENFFEWYDKAIAFINPNYQWLVSLGIIILIVALLWKLIKKTYLFLILLIIFIPASIPIFRNFLLGLLEFIRQLAAR
jgi:hypothetical protein